MPTPVENYIFNELPRRIVVDSGSATGSSLTAGWVIVATGSGFQAVATDPATLGFEPEVAAGTATEYYRGDKTWATLDATAVGAIASSEKGQPLGVATLDADGYVLMSQINPAAIERVVVVLDEAARYALTTAQVQNGDVVNQQLDGNNDPNPLMWFVYDDQNLNNPSGYLPFSAGVAASVDWAGITNVPGNLVDIGAIVPNNQGDLIQYDGTNWVGVDVNTFKSSLQIEIDDVDGLQTALDDKQDHHTNLDELSAMNTTGVVIRNTDGEFIGREIIGTAGVVVTEGDGNADNISVGLGEVGTAGTYGDEDNFPTYEVDAYGRVISTTTKSLVKDTLTLLDQVADQNLVANTTYEIGEYTNTLNLLMPDPVSGGTTVTLAVPMVLAAPVGDITVVFPTGKELFGFSLSIPLKSTLDPLPGDRIVFTYSSNASKWVVYKTQSLYQKRLYLVGTSSSNPTLDPHIYHSFISNATTNRSISIPDTDIDLSAVGQTEFFDSEFRIKDSTTPTKKISFNGSGITVGQTRMVTIPDADVDLGKVSHAASSGVDGYLTGTDWNTFNGKQAALVSGTNIKSINGTSLLGNGDLVVKPKAQELLASTATQTLADGITYYLPGSYAGALNLALPTSAPVGTWLELTSMYSTAIDGTQGVNLTALNLTVPSGEIITGWGGAPNPINLLVSYVTNDTQYSTPNFTQGCTFRFTKVTSTMWAMRPTTGAALPATVFLKNSTGGVGGTILRDQTTAGNYAVVKLPSVNADLGNLSFVAKTNSNTLSGTRTHIMGGSNNTVSGTDVVAVGCTGCDLSLYTDKVTAIGVLNTINFYAVAPRQAILLGSSALTTSIFDISGAHAAALGVIQCVYSGVCTANGTTFNATLNGANTPSSTNCIKLLPAASVLSSAVIDLDFIIVVGDNMAGAQLAPRRTVFAKRRVYIVFAFNDSDVGTFNSSVEVIGTDTSVGSAATGTVTVGVTVDSANNRLIPTVSATSGSKQTLFQFGVRSTAHYNRNI